MPETLTQVAPLTIDDGMNDLRQQVIESQKAKGLRASGASAESLRVETSGTSSRLYGSRTFTWQQNGRGPNRSGKPGKAQLDGLREWIAIRGIDAGALWPIAISQAKKGTPVPNPHNPGGVLSDVLNKENVKKTIGDRLRQKLTTTIKSNLFST